MSVTISLLAVFLLLTSRSTEGQVVGVCYGTQGSGLPTPQQTVQLFKANNIRLVRIYSPDQQILQAVQGSGIQLVLGVSNPDIPALAQNPSFAMQWVQNNVVPYASSIRYIVVGNEVKSYNIQYAQYVGPAMQNVLDALRSVNLGDGRIPVSTSVGASEVKNAYPPSSGEFSDPAFMFPIVKFLTTNGFPLLVNVYPYFTYKYSTGDIPLDYAIFTSNGAGFFTDPSNGLQYKNLFDATVDSVYAAITKAEAAVGAIKNARASFSKLLVSETSWPSQGGRSTTVEIAGLYNRNLANHVRGGTPLRGEPLETYMFGMFDENQKQGDEDERHFGLFSPDGQPKYGRINFG